MNMKKVISDLEALNLGSGSGLLHACPSLGLDVIESNT